MTEQQLRTLYQVEQKKEREAASRFQQTGSSADGMAWERAIGRVDMARELWYASLTPLTWQPWMGEAAR